MVRKQLRPAIPKPDTPRPVPSRKGPSIDASAATKGSIKEDPGEGEGGDFSDAAAAAVTAAAGNAKKNSDRDRGKGNADEGKEGQEEEKAGRISPR